MTCNRCAATAEVAAPAVGAAHLEGNWAGNRAHPQYCSKCHSFLRADGSCTVCEGRTAVTSDGETLAMAVTSDAAVIKMRLSCGHAMTTAVSPGSEEWCTKCDDFVTVEAPAQEISPDETILFSPPDSWGPGRVQLWGMLEQEARRLGIAKVVREWTGFADSPASSKAKGKVDGFFYGQSSDGEWYFVTANGPVGIARLRKTIHCAAGEIEAEALFFGRHGQKKREFGSMWPCDGSGRGVIKCHVCGAIISSGSACYNCDPKRARADAERAVYGGWL